MRRLRQTWAGRHSFELAVIIAILAAIALVAVGAYVFLPAGIISAQEEADDVEADVQEAAAADARAERMHRAEVLMRTRKGQML